MRIVIALGGNALLRRRESLDADTQRRNARRAAEAVADLAGEHSIVVTHGNGPQIGLLAMQAAAYEETPAYPLDILGAESEGMIGYLLEQELMAALPGHSVATVLTQTLVDPHDPAFNQPTKYVGPSYDQRRAQALETRYGWRMALDGQSYRRVVASPQPTAILELAAIRTLVEAGTLVVAAGGGGVPVCRDSSGALHGREAVVDKDLASALLARQLGADQLLMLTDVDAVYRNWGGENPEAVAQLVLDDIDNASYDPGSMGPKIQAAAAFAKSGGRAAIGALEQAGAILAGRAGTRIVAVRE